MVRAGAVAVSDDGRPVMNAELMRRALFYAQHFGMPVIQHAEDLNLSGKRRHARGRVVDAARPARHPGPAEDVMVARDLILLEDTGGPLPRRPSLDRALAWTWCARPSDAACRSPAR